MSELLACQQCLATVAACVGSCGAACVAVSHWVSIMVNKKRQVVLEESRPEPPPPQPKPGQIKDPVIK